MKLMKRQRPYRKALERLRSAGVRSTRQRLGLAKLLFDGDDRHVTAEMLYGEALRARVRVSLATVYNTLKQFMDAGLLREVVVDPCRSYFDTNVTDHHHFFHENSNLLVDIPGEQLIVSNIPELPAGTAIERIDVVIRVNDV